MKLQDIDKKRYRKHLNMVIVALIISLMTLALSFGQLFIALLSSADGDNFIFNLSGVALAGAICLGVLHRLRHHEFMREVFYVWQLKQSLNKIYRKLRKIEAARDDGNVDAFIILNFYYAASSQLFKLDDNTITMDSLQAEINKLAALLESNDVKVSLDDYNSAMLAAF
ncbi:MAG: DUF3087 family protein [Bermanella sp.]